MSTPLQYLRALSCQVGNYESPAGLEFATFRIQFEVRRGDLQTPNSCDVRIFNVSDATLNNLVNGFAAGEFTRLVVSAGYGNTPGQIFDGSITQVRAGRVDQKDTYVDITAADSDEAYNFSVVAQSWAAGTDTPLSQVQTFLQTMAASATAGGQPPVSAGYGADGSVALPSDGSIRGRVMCGRTKDCLRRFARNNNLVWSLQDGKMVLVPMTSYIPGTAYVLTPATGLVGIPEQTQEGISARILLNPNIRIGTLVQIKGIVNSERYGLDIGSVLANFALQSGAGKLNSEGTYYVMRVEHHGDSRGQEWYSDLVCMAVDITVPVGNPDQSAIGPVSGPMQAGVTY